MGKNKIYTKIGDKGLTTLLGGTKVEKTDIRLELYGGVDELNSLIGMVISVLMKEKNFQEELDFLKKQQRNLFVIGSFFSCEREKRERYNIKSIGNEAVLEIEKYIDKMEKDLPELKNFILSGGSIASSWLHMARTFCRNLERKFVSYRNIQKDDFDNSTLSFLNRISDCFFVLARAVNYKMNIKEDIYDKTIF